MAKKYIIDEGEVVPMDDLVIWAKWYEEADRLVAKTRVGPFQVVTFFTALDYRPDGQDGAPLLWETTVMPALEGAGSRYTTAEGARIGHQRIVQHVLEHAREKDSKVEAIVEEERKKQK